MTLSKIDSKNTMKAFFKDMLGSHPQVMQKFTPNTIMLYWSHWKVYRELIKKKKDPQKYFTDVFEEFMKEGENHGLKTITKEDLKPKIILPNQGLATPQRIIH